MEEETEQKCVRGSEREKDVETPTILANNADKKCALFIAVRLQEPCLIQAEMCHKGSFFSILFPSDV